MKSSIRLLLLLILPLLSSAQDLSQGLIINDLDPHPMQEVAKPAYLNTITDPAFGTTIRRITNAAPGEVIVPMYSTIQAWNADESLMILYNQSTGTHELLNGMNYAFVRHLDDINPIDLEQIFWDFNDPDILYYPESQTNDFIRYTLSTQSKETIVNLTTISNCNGEIEMGNDIQMMSWDSDVFTFRCDNDASFSYRISTGGLNLFNIDELNYTAPSVGPSGDRFQHGNEVYNSTGVSIHELNKSSVEHSCIGRSANFLDAYYAIAFAEGPEGGCIGDIIAHSLTNGNCFPVISQNQGYDYPQSGTHISALAHKNTESGWLAASMIGYDQDGQELLDQELVIARAQEGNIIVCRIGHHRSDEDQFDYWGEPHAVISPTGTRVLFGSDWSGGEDGQSVDSYVVELPAFSEMVSTLDPVLKKESYTLFPNPVDDHLVIDFENSESKELTVCIYNSNGEEVIRDQINSNQYALATDKLNSGVYFFQITDLENIPVYGKFIKSK